MKLHYLNILVPFCVAGLAAVSIVALQNNGIVQIQSDWLDILIDGTAQAEKVLPGAD